MHRFVLVGLLIATRAFAQDPPPSPHWQVELDSTETFDNQQRSADGWTHSHHSAHVTLLLDIESPIVHDGHLRINTTRPTVVGFSGSVDGGRDAATATSEASLEYRGKILRDQIKLSISYDGPDRWALDFGVGLDTKGTNTACIKDAVHKTCAAAEIAPLAAFGWTLDSKRGGQITHRGDDWVVSYAHDDTDSAPGKTRRHRELKIRMHPKQPGELAQQAKPSNPLINPAFR